MAWKETGGSSPFIPVDPYPGSYPNANPNAAGLGAAGGIYSRTGASYTTCGSAGPAASSTLTSLIFVSGNGTQINLVDNATNGAAYTVPNPCGSQPSNWNGGRGTVFHSVDGSMLVFRSDSAVLDWNPNATAPGTAGRGRALLSGYLLFPNGVTYRIDNSAVSWLRDRNGNMLALVNNGPEYALDWYVNIAAPTQITDSQNRTISINYNNSNCGGCTTISYPGAGGATRTIQIELTNLSNGLLRSGSVSEMGALFPQGFQTTYNFDPVLASAIVYPDGSSYWFRYDNYGEIAQVTAPMGGAIQYDYGDGQNGSTDGFVGTPSDANPVMIYRRLQERREYANGLSLGMTARTHYTVGYPSGQTTDTDVAYDASGNVLTQTKHTLAGSPLDALSLTSTGCNAWNEGLEVETDLGSPMLLTVQNSYQASRAA